MKTQRSIDRKTILTRLAGPVAALGLVLAVLFLPVLVSGHALQAADCAAHGMVIEKSFLPGNIAGSWGPQWLGRRGGVLNPLPRRLLLLVLSADAYQVLAFVADTALLFAAALYLLRGLNLSRRTAGIAALALAFSGHSFTLIAAGHLSKFGMMPFAVLTFACLHRAMARRSVFYFVLTGVCAGIGLSEHQDVMMMFLLLAAAYGLFLLVVGLLRADRRLPFVSRTGLGVLVAGVFFLAMSAPTLFSTLTVTVKEREAITDGTEEGKWEFATNWSMPTEELFEFVAPCIYGVETSDRKAPYWGRLGRTLGWEKTRQGLFNLRQHTVYVGVLQLVFAAFAVCVYGRRRRVYHEEHEDHEGKKGNSCGPRSGPTFKSFMPFMVGHSGSNTPDFRANRRAEVWFWAIAWAICVLLALGRYAPLYKLFYSLPYASGIRAPVKFMHLVELCTVMLFAFGLEAFFGRGREEGTADEHGCTQMGDKKKSSNHEGHEDHEGKKDGSIGPQSGRTFKPFMPFMVEYSGRLLAGFAIGCAVLAGIMLFATFWALAGPGWLKEYWAALGVAQMSDAFAKNMARALFHGAVLFGVCAGLFWWRRRGWKKEGTTDEHGCTRMGKGKKISNHEGHEDHEGKKDGSGGPQSGPAFKPFMSFMVKNSQGKASVFSLWAPWVVLAVLALDLVAVGRRYVKTVDMRPIYKTDPIVERLRAQTEPYRVMCPAMDGMCQRWMQYKFPYYGINTIDLSVMSGIAPDYKAYFGALRENPFRLWQLANVRFLVGPVQSLKPLLDHPAFAVEVAVGVYQGRDGGIEMMAVPVEQASHVLLRNQAALPRVALFHAWRCMDEEAQVAALSDAEWNPMRSALASCAEGQGKTSELPAQSAPIEDYAATKIDVTVTAQEEGLLLLNDRYDDGWNVAVDGRDAELLRCNAIVRGVKVPAGRHRVAFRYHSPYLPYALARFAALGVALGWIVVRGVGKRRT
jgi:hypothetical protein